MVMITVDAPPRTVAKIVSRLQSFDRSWILQSRPDEAQSIQSQTNDADSNVLVYVPGCRGNSQCLPCVEHAQTDLGSSDAFDHVILVSSAAFYGAHHHNQGMLEEPSGTQSHTKGKNSLTQAWADLETVFRAKCQDRGIKLTVLRPASVDEDTLPHNVVGHSAFRPMLGFNPAIQVLPLDELCAAIGCAVKSSREGTFNIAPATTQLLSEALSSNSWLPQLPCFVRKLFARNSEAADILEFVRYSWTVSGRKAEAELGYAPSSTCSDEHASIADSFGMSPSLIRAFGRHIFWFMEKCFWRIEVRGLENIPQNGKAVLAGFHRGFMPFDGVMLVHLLSKYRQRIPRFVIHPSLIKFPFIANFMARLGGVVACQKNANHVLENGEMLGIFPEGIRGAFSVYKDAYQVSSSWRDDFARFAVDHNAVVIPIAVVGSADTFPILGRIPWKWGAKQLEWPFLPITPTFPLLLLPLPVKWHIHILPPIRIADLGANDHAEKRELITALSSQVRDSIQSAVNDMLAARPSKFYGSAFAPSFAPLEPINEVAGLQPDGQAA